MLMDEPSNSMDHTTELRLMKRLRSEYKTETMLIITQKMSLLDMVDRVIVMHNTRVLLDGDKDEVIRKMKGVKK